MDRGEKECCERFNLNFTLKFLTKNVFLHKIKNNDTRFKYSLESI
jgi:hypothetical protein